LVFLAPVQDDFVLTAIQQHGSCSSLGLFGMQRLNPELNTVCTLDLIDYALRSEQVQWIAADEATRDGDLQVVEDLGNLLAIETLDCLR
jgi:hypothetical protein